MAQYNFEGDFENINERQLELINKVIQEQDLKASRVIFSSVGLTNHNSMANVKSIIIEGKYGNLKMIVKIASAFKRARKMTITEIMFNNEHTMYTVVLPKLVQLQKDAGVPEKEQLKYAKCYGSLMETPNEVVILEDLNKSGFTMLNKFESLSDECVKSILKNFAVFHSLSFVLKKKEPETYDLFKSKLTNVWEVIADNHRMMSHIIPKFENEILSVFDDEAHTSIIKNKIQNIFKVAVNLSNAPDKFTVFQQGDAWTNNIMFKFAGDGLVQSIMIDYQNSKVSNPVIDLLYMIFNCTDHETRIKYYYNWLDYYYMELDKSLSNFGLNANFVYPRDQLDADLKRYGNFIFGQSLMLANVLLGDSKEASKFMEARKKSELSDEFDAMRMEDMNDNTMVRFKKRVVGLIDSFTEFDLLSN